jgi:hypothetical protein
MSRCLRAFLSTAAIAAVAVVPANAAEITPPASAVTASTHDGNLPGNTVDNNLGTRWSAIGDGHWVRLDLGMVRPVGSIGVAVYNGNMRRNRFDLQLSTDGANWTTVFAGESSGTTTAEQGYDFADQDARYVRYLGHGSSDPTKPLTNSVTEISVFDGVVVVPTPTPTDVPPSPTPTPTPTPILAFTRLTPAGVSASTNDGNVPANAIDGSLATRWSANGDGAWLQIDLGATYSVGRVRIAVYNGNSRQNRFDLQTGDGTTWDNVLTDSQTSGTTTLLESYDFSARGARFVRYVGHMSNVGTFNSLTEVEVWGTPCTSCPTPVPTLTPTPTPTSAVTATPTPTPRPVGGTIYFQSTGSKTHFPNYPQNPQNLGRIDDVSSPVYKGTTAIRFEQTYVDNATERYHSEVTIHGVQSNGQDKYYGFALYLPTTWHNEVMKDNFQQWGAENPGGPWLLMWINNDHIQSGHPRTFGTTDFGAISKGVWHTTVSRLRMSNGVPFEFWVDGTRRGAPNCTCSVTGGSVRWSAGIYISYWYDRYRSGLPSGSQRVRYLLQDHYRIASTYAAADPANW